MSMPQRLPRISGRDQTLALAGFAVGLVIVIVGNYHVSKDESGGTGPALFTSILCLVLTAALFGYVVPRAQNPERTSLVLGIIAVVSVVAFWSGVTPVLAAAAVALARRVASPPTSLRVVTGLAVVLSAAALVVTIVQS